MGKLKENYWKDACAEYEKRLTTFCRFSIHEIPEIRLPERPSDAQIQAALASEGKKLLEAAGDSRMIAMCVEGKQISSPGLAEMLGAFADRGFSRVSFVIGSSFGLDESVKKAACLKLSMSEMTFPHQLARVMLCEQIYRSFEILGNGKYHK